MNTFPLENVREDFSLFFRVIQGVVRMPLNGSKWLQKLIAACLSDG
jgi:hypothetical protein